MVRFNLVITLLLMINMAVKAELTNRMFDVRHVGYAEGLVVNVFFRLSRMETVRCGLLQKPE